VTPMPQVRILRDTRERIGGYDPEERCPGQVTTQATVGSLIAWAQRHHVHLVCAGDRRSAAQLVWQHCRRAILDDQEQQDVVAEAGAQDATTGARGGA